MSSVQCAPNEEVLERLEPPDIDPRIGDADTHLKSQWLLNSVNYDNP